MNAVIQTDRRAMQPILVPQTFDQLVIFADLAATSGMVPRDFAGKPGAIMIAVQMGSELGLSPMQALQSIAVINGRPGVWGDGLIGLCRASPLCEDITETIEGEGDERTAICIAKRRGASTVRSTFSVADAKKAGLWQTEAKVRRKGKDGNWYDAVNDSPWFRYPDRMLQNRARGFALRDAFPDVLRGLKTVEELRDYPVDDYQGVTLDAKPEPSVARNAERATHPADKTPPLSRRDEINRDVPLDQTKASAKPTARAWIDKLRIELDAADTEDAVDAIAGREDVRRMLGWLKNGALGELNAMLAEAIDRVRAIETYDDGSAEDGEHFPGDVPIGQLPGEQTASEAMTQLRTGG